MENKKCRFFDDGHGNGSYLSGASCGPPNCKFYTLGGKAEMCWGDIKKCNVDNLRKDKLNEIINKIKKEI